MATTTTNAPETETSNGYTAWGVLIWIGALHVGAALALFPAYFSWSGVALMFLLHWVTGGLGICMTYHRLLTHRSFVCRPKAFEYFLTILGCCASEGGAIGWVADHRRHHAFSDTDEDAHTPRRSFGWAHMFWFMTPDISSRHTPEYYQKWAPDLERDKVHVFLDKNHLVFPLLMFLGLYLIGNLFTPKLGMSWLVWGGFLRTVLVLHATWLVNSATHVWGYRTHPTRDDSTNLWWVAIVTYGEGWHNNHHAYQTSARHGIRWWEVDMTYMAIKALSYVGLVHTIKMPKIPKIGVPINDPSQSDEAPLGESFHTDEERELAVSAK
jgi:fatty-acid desaturase